MTGIDVLDGAALLIERGHCTGANARDTEGRPVYPHDPEAVAWDMTGALLVAGRDAVTGAFLDALHGVAKSVGVFGYDAAREWRCEELPTLTREMCEKVWKWEDAAGRKVAHVLSAIERAKEYV